MKVLRQIEFAKPDSEKLSDDEPLIVHVKGESSNQMIAIFVHGLGGTPYGDSSTWGYFPKYLFDDLPACDVGLYHYRTLFGRLRLTKSIPMETEAKILAGIIRDELNHYQSIVLLGHSMGGLLCKAVLSQLIHNNDNHTLSRIVGLFLLATPQLGSLRVPKFLSYLSRDFRVLRTHNRLLTEISSTLEDNLYTDERNSTGLAKLEIPTWAILGGEDFWVDELSGGVGLSSSQKKIVRGSHTAIVKPKSKDGGAYSWVYERVVKCSSRYKYDVFIAAAMAGHQDDEDYKKSRTEVLQVEKTLKEHCNMQNIYYAGKNLDSKDDFEAKSLSLEIDIQSLRDSRYFLLLYPQKIVSSVLFEAGIALAIGKPSVYFVKDRKDLPFLMEQAGQADIRPGVRIYEYDDINMITKHIGKHKQMLWKELVCL